MYFTDLHPFRPFWLVLILLYRYVRFLVKTDNWCTQCISLRNCTVATKEIKHRFGPKVPELVYSGTLCQNSPIRRRQPVLILPLSSQEHPKRGVLGPFGTLAAARGGVSIELGSKGQFWPEQPELINLTRTGQFDA